MSAPAAHFENRLIHEKSPYLLQHAHNPVDWFPWGDEAFQKARDENKPVLISIGYSTCHWCHVMERESYENPEIAALMNRYLVNIKIDREERPDIDKIYMTAVSAMTGSGGWPLNVFLTPDREPFFGGTYFSPEARWGNPGWADVVTQIGEAWAQTEERTKVIAMGQRVTEALKNYTTATQVPVEGSPQWLDDALPAFQASYDSTRGGFSPAPKFPMPVYHDFLHRYAARTMPHPGRRHDRPLPKGEGRAKPEGEAALEMSLHTLREMARGGIYDHLGGGFARYSTDANWHVPHFEKMLYDNAQLATIYLQAWQLSGDDAFRQVARETLDYIRRDMTHPEGAFYSAEDADSLATPVAAEKKEGAFYVWSLKEIQETLGEKAAALFAFRYGVREGGNAASDPHGEFKNLNILYQAHPIPEAALKAQMTPEEALKVLEEGKAQLFKRRLLRPRPHLDDKVISGWNGLMISAYAKGYQALNDPRDLASAQKAARFLKAHLFCPETHTLYRRWRDGERKERGISDDYSFVIHGLLDLYESDFDAAWLDWAIELTDILNDRFYDRERGGYFMTELGQDPHLILRVKEDSDNVEPSASSIAALNLLRLAQFTNHQDYRDAAQKTLACFGQTMKDSPRALPSMLGALDFALSEPRQIVIAGTPGAEDTRRLLEVVYRQYLPVKTLILADGGPVQSRLSHWLPFIAGMKPIEGRATAYVCYHQTCQAPTTDPEILERLLST